MSDYFILQVNKTGQFMGAGNTLTREHDEAINFHNSEITTPEFHEQVINFTNIHGSVRRVVTDC